MLRQTAILTLCLIYFINCLHLLFIDLTKTYGSVPLNKLWETLDESAINTRLIEAIKSLYEGPSSKIKA
jgi:hypothetical protein